MPAAIPIAVAVGGAAIKAYSANKAAGVQKRAASAASTIEQEKLDQTAENFDPYLKTGAQANGLLSSRLNELTAPVTMDQATLEKTPGYQFNLTQGLKAAQNSAAARGLGTSGAAFKGAEKFATGLADSTYQNQFNNAVTNQTNSYNRLLELAGLGETSANNLGVFANKTGQSMGTNIIGAGDAGGAAAVATGNAVANGLKSAGNAYIAGASGIYGK